MIPAIISALGGASAAGGAGGAAGGIAQTVAGLAGSGGGVGGSIGKLTQSLGGLGSPLKLVESGIQKFYKGLTALPDKILEAEQMIVSIGQKWVAALSAPINTVKQLGDAIAPFTRLSNPGGMKIFEMRVENAMATIGNILQPILDALTRSAEKMGDLFARLKPAFAPAMEAVSELIDFIATRFADIAEFVAPGIKMASELFLGLVRIFEMIQRPITGVIRGFTELRNMLYDFLGIQRSFDKNAKSDLAIKEPRYIGAEDLFREQAKNALMASMGPQDQKKDVPTLIEQIKTKLDNLPQKIAGAIASAILQVKIVQAIRNEAREQISGTPLETPTRYGVFGLGGIAVSR